MSKKHNGVNWNKSSKTKERRKKVITRLEQQLESKEKLVIDPNKIPKGVFSIGANGYYIPLSESDISRINKEIETLKLRL